MHIVVNKTTHTLGLIGALAIALMATGTNIRAQGQERSEETVQTTVDGLVERRRRASALFGIGHFEMVVPDVIRQVADPTDLNRDGISGRPSSVAGAIGLFGWKATASTLGSIVRVALASEMGLTTSTFPCDVDQKKSCEQRPEVDESEVEALVQFVRGLAAPPPPVLTPAAKNGEKVFAVLGCTGCHRPRLSIAGPRGRAPVSIAPYTDLLLHDMGSALSDPFPDRNVDGNEFRTAPLWGVTVTGPPYLHDGRAGTLDEAIRAHDGEAEAAAGAYRALQPEKKAALLQFLSAL